MSKPEIERIWINVISARQGLSELRLDWDNDRHHAIRIEPPFGREEVARAFESATHLIMTDDNLL